MPFGQSGRVEEWRWTSALGRVPSSSFTFCQRSKCKFYAQNLHSGRMCAILYGAVASMFLARLGAAR